MKKKYDKISPTEERLSKRSLNSINFPRRSFLKKISLFSGSMLLGQYSRVSGKKTSDDVPVMSTVDTFGQNTVPVDTLAQLDLRQITVGGEIGRRINITANNNLLALDIDKDFILPFKKKEHRGEGYSDYIGLGKNIDATVRLAAYTKNDKVLALKRHILDEIINSQEPDGYIGIMVKESRMWKLWDIHEMGYLILGLTSDYHYFREKRSLVAAQKLADYIIKRWATMPAGWQKWGALGLESNMLALYRETNERRYLDFCVQQCSLPQWKLDIPAGRGVLMKGHVYTEIDLCLAQLELFHVQYDEKLLKSGRDAIDFLTAHDGMTITGAAGLWEMWTNDQSSRGPLGETCATAYQIRLFNKFLLMDGNSRYGDILERIIYNTLFAAQSPDGRQLRYFTPFENDRTYFRTDTYCCPNNFRRIISELPGMVYYQSAKGVTVNLYTPSEATIDLEGGVSLRIRQETDYPSSGKVIIHLDPSKPVSFQLQLRIPRWCDKTLVSVNEKPLEETITSGEFLPIMKEWSTGDQVTLEMSMPWRFVLGRKRQSGRVAVMRGPLIYCLNPAQNATLQKKDAADLINFVIDPDSLKLMSDDLTVHAGGTACSVKAADRSITLEALNNLTLKLTEFPDPEGKVIYFRIPDFSVAVPDEILFGDS
jgi:uncharacterized protein